MKRDRAAGVASMAILAASAAGGFVACGSSGAGDVATSHDGAAPLPRRPSGPSDSSVSPSDDTGDATTGDLDAGAELDGAATGDDGAVGPSDGSADGSIVDAAPRCDASAPFQAPAAVYGVNTPANEARPSLSPDELTIYFDRGAEPNRDIYMATRATIADAFATPVALTAVSSPNDDADPAISADGATLFLTSDRTAGGSGFQLYMSTRGAAGTFGAPTLVPNVNAGAPPYFVTRPYPLADGTALWFSAEQDDRSPMIYHSSWNGASFGAPVAEAELSTPQGYASVLSADALTVFLVSGAATNGISVATRADRSALFSAPTAVPGLNVGEAQVPGWVSPDGCTLYFETELQGSTDLYFASRGH